MKKKILKYIGVVSLLVVTLEARAQGNMEIDQKWLCRSLFNPAATGNTSSLDLYAIAREQWVGIDGAPSTQILYGHLFLPQINSGIGFGITNEFIGFYQTLDIKASYAYNISLSTDLRLAFGLAGNLTWNFRDDSKINFEYPTGYAPPFESSTKPNFDIGVELRNKWLKLGISALQMIESDKAPVSQRNFNIYALTRFELGEYIDFGPSLAGTLRNSSLDAEVGALFYYKRTSSKMSLLRLRSAYEKHDFLWAGVYYHTNKSISILAGISISDQWRLGYAYGYSYNLISESSPASHEVLLSWRIPLSFGVRKYYCVDC